MAVKGYLQKRICNGRGYAPRCPQQHFRVRYKDWYFTKPETRSSTEELGSGFGFVCRLRVIEVWNWVLSDAFGIVIRRG
jgi:hypothetical protein